MWLSNTTSNPSLPSWFKTISPFRSKISNNLKTQFHWEWNQSRYLECWISLKALRRHRERRKPLEEGSWKRRSNSKQEVQREKGTRFPRKAEGAAEKFMVSGRRNRCGDSNWDETLAAPLKWGSERLNWRIREWKKEEKRRRKWQRTEHTHFALLQARQNNYPYFSIWVKYPRKDIFLTFLGHIWSANHCLTPKWIKGLRFPHSSHFSRF